MDTLDGSHGLPEEVCFALRHWARQVALAGQSRPCDDPSTEHGQPVVDVQQAGDWAATVSLRGERLAAVVAAAYGEPVEYLDPVDGVLRPVGPRREGDRWGEPTPWASGLTVLGFVALVVAAMDLALTATLRADYRWVWLPANVLVALGLTPTVVLLRGTPFWRWVAYGIAVGLAGAWLGLLATALF